MKKPILISFLLFSFFIASAQKSFLVFKKKNKTIENYWVGSTIAFQTKDKEWRKGDITEIQNDSFYIRPIVMQYSLYRIDTFYYDIQKYSISDVYAMPKRGVLVDYKDGKFQIINSGGHQHWYWIKSGALFKVLGLGYATLTIVNGAISGDLSSSQNKTQLAISAGLVAAGVAMKKAYSQTLKLRKKYYLKIIEL
jgi:hypothetical protein